MSPADVPMPLATDTQDSSAMPSRNTNFRTLVVAGEHHQHRRCHRHTASTSSCPVPSTAKNHGRHFTIQSSTSVSSSVSSSVFSSSSDSRGQSPDYQQNRRQTQFRSKHHSRTHSATAATSGPPPSFFRRIFKVFAGNNGAPPLNNAAMDASAYTHGFYEDHHDIASQTDETGSCEECECSCGNRPMVIMDYPSPGQQSNPAARYKKRSNSTASTSSVASSVVQYGRGINGVRPGYAYSIGGDNMQSYCAANSASGGGHCSSGSGSGMGKRRSSVTSSIAGESIHYDLGNYNRKSGDKNRTFISNSQQYRQYLTGHGPTSTTVPVNANQQEAMKRRLSFFKSVVAGPGPTSRRGSAFSTKSQETAVNLTGINPADEFEQEYDDDDEDMDLDEKDGDDDDDNDLDKYFDENDMQEALCLGRDYYSTHDSMLTPDVELDIHRRRQEAARLAVKRHRYLRHLRRQSLLSDSNNLAFRNKAAGCNVCAPPLLKCEQRPSPIQLPEILHLIFQFVVDMTPQEDFSQREIHNCLLVSKQWYLVAQKTLWREIRFKNPAKLELFINMLRRTETVEHLGIERCSKRTNATETLFTAHSELAIVPFQPQRKTSVFVQGQQEASREDSIMSPMAMQKRLYERASAVKKIVLHKLKLVEDKDIMPLTSWFHNLQILEFYICERLTDKIVVSVAENCPQLQQLLMPGCAKVTDIGISKIALRCPRMKHLDLRACSNVSDESLVLVAKHCPDLWHLNVGRVSSAAKVTGRSIVEIAKNTNLNTLGLAGCAMTDEAVIEIARYSRSVLHRISLNSCPMLTSASVRALMQLCPNLAVLEIKQCLLVTDMAILYRFSTRRVLVELCPELQKRLLEYKVELASMNASMQPNSFASTQVAGSGNGNGNGQNMPTMQAMPIHNDNQNNNNDNNDPAQHPATTPVPPQH